MVAASSSIIRAAAFGICVRLVAALRHSINKCLNKRHRRPAAEAPSRQVGPQVMGKPPEPPEHAREREDKISEEGTPTTGPEAGDLKLCCMCHMVGEPSGAKDEA